MEAVTIAVLIVACITSVFVVFRLINEIKTIKRKHREELYDIFYSKDER